MELKHKVAQYYKDEYEFLMSRMCNRLHNRSDAEEVLSEAAISVLRQVDTGSLTDPKDIPRFFTTCMLSRSIDFLRKNDKVEGINDELESGLVTCQQMEEPLSPEEVLEAEQASRTIIDLIDLEANDKRRGILTRIFVYNQRPKQVSKELRVSTGYIRQVVGKFKKEYPSEESQV